MCAAVPLFPWSSESSAVCVYWVIKLSAVVNDAFIAYTLPTGRGARFDNIEELSGMSEETMRLFFHAWTRVMSVKMDDQWITPPRTPEELSRVEKVFNRLGLPGACTSFSCTHVGWDCCPAGIEQCPSQTTQTLICSCVCFCFRGAKGHATRVFLLSSNRTT